MPRFGKDKEKDSARKAELDRQAQEEVERLTRRAGPPGMGGGGMGGGMGGPGMPGMGPIGMPSPLERIAAEVRDAPRPSMRKQQPPRRPAAPTPQAFTPLPSGSVGSSFGPGGLNPGPRMAAMAPPPPAFGGGAYDEDYGGPVTGPPVYNAEPDEDEEMTITEMALMDHAARTGHNPEDLVVQYDASSAEEMRDAAMRAFYERQQSRGPGVRTNNPFAPAGMRAGPAGPPTARQAPQNPAAAGGALAQRLANRRKREEEQARRAAAEAAPAAAPAAAAPQRAPARPAATRAKPEPVVEKAEPAENQGALARVLARRRAALGIDEPAEAAEPEPQPEDDEGVEEVEEVEEVETSAGPHGVPLEPVVDERAPSLEEMAAATARTPRKASPTKKTASKAAGAKKAPAAAKAPAAKKTKKAGATLASTAAPATKKTPASKKKAAAAPAPGKAPAKKAPAKKAAPGATSRAKAVFCIECGERNPAIAKFCFNCGTRLAAPED